MRNWSGRIENTSRSLLRSFGALFFAPGSVSGLLFLVAIAAVAPQAAWMAVTGALAANAAAHLLGGIPKLIEDGIYGYNGVLAGLGSMAFLPLGEAGLEPVAGGTWSLVLALCSGALAGVLMSLWMKAGWAEKPGLPALTWPSLIGVWVFGALFSSLGLVTLSADALFPPVVDVGFHGWLGVKGAFEFWFDQGLPYLPVAVFLVLGFALETPRRLPAAVTAVLLSVAAGGLFLGPRAPLLPSYTFYTAAPLAMALGWFFLVPSVGSLVVAVVSLAPALWVWHEAGLLLESWDMPLLTLPFAAVGLGVLAVMRLAPRSARRFLPELVPLHRVGLPEAKRYGPGRKAGRRYWDQVAALARADLTGVPAKRIEDAVSQFAVSERVVALTGAGLSTESGIPDYRSGIIDWQVYDPDELTYARFLADEGARRTYWRMSQDFYLLLREAQPARGHRALAALERMGKLQGIITQNVDRLHQKAGSSSDRVVEIHGHEFGVTCLNCGAKYSRDEVYRWILHGTEVPYCIHCEGGFLKPDSIAFGQPMPFEASRRALDLIDRCDLLLVAGTSLSVEPVSSLVARAAGRGARLILVNLEPTDFDAVADVVLHGVAGAVLDAIAKKLSELKLWVDV